MTDANSPLESCVPTPGPRRQLRKHLAPVFLVIAVTAVVFAPSLGNELLQWDDVGNLVEETRYRGLGWAQIKWAFTTFENGHYMPLVWLSWGLDYLLWGVDPFGFHLTNLILHCANALMVYALALALLGRSGSRPGTSGGTTSGMRFWAALAALLFAVHPLRVESVVWATERKDLLSSAFYLLTVILYLRGEGRRWVWPAIVFVLAALSKVMVVSLPVVLLVLDVYPLGRLGGGQGWFTARARRVLWQKIPFVLTAGVVAVLAPLAQSHVGSMTPWEIHGLAARLAVCGYGFAFYAAKTLVPLGLSPLYELRMPISLAEAKYVLGGAATVAAFVLVFVLRRRVPSLAAVAVSYVAILLPVLGLTQNGTQLVADRYSYLACVGWVILASGGLSRLGGSGFRRRGAVVLASILAVAALSAATVRQSRHWRNTRALWARALEIDPECVHCHLAMGRALAEEEPGPAEEHYRQALSRSPTNGDLHNNLGILLRNQGRLEEGLAHLQRAVSLEPDNGVWQFNCADALGLAGLTDRALEHYRQAAAAPGWDPPAKLYSNWAYVLISTGRFAEAVERARVAVAADPSSAEARYNLGVALLNSGGTVEGVEHLRAMVRCRPPDAGAYLHAARALSAQNLTPEAKEILEAGTSRFPADPSLTRELQRLPTGDR